MEQNSFYPTSEDAPSTETAPTTSQLQAVVDYMPNISIVGSQPALLEWTADNHIRLFEMDFDTNQAKSVMFDVPVAEIQKITGSANMLTFHVAGKTYRTLFARMVTAGMGGVGAIAALGELKASGANIWIKKLKESGVKVNIFGMGMSFLVVIIGVLIIAGVVFATQQ